jgi:perosamine synthetase|tara:strand:- start:5321 stop:6439 length:1119 start_codon:yes stop_codon:yes gene_type:complete
MKIKVAEPFTGKEEYRSLKKIIYSGKFVSGEKVNKFEKNFSKFLGIKYSAAFNSGTAALHSALNSLNLIKSDEVIVPAISFMSTATAVLHNGSIPIFCDVNLDNYCMDPNDFARKITKNTKVVIPVHFAGSACNMDEIIKIAKRKKIFVIEDCAQAHGTKFNKKLVGTFGDISCFSFYATKHMTTGEGGMLCTNNKNFERNSKIFRNHGMVNRDEHQMLGYNYRMNEISAQMGIEQLKKLNIMNNKRISNSLFILKSLKLNNKKWFEKQKINSKVFHTYFWCPLRIISKKISLKKVKVLLKKKGIEIRSRYQKPLYKQKVIQKLNIKSSQNYKKLYLTNAEKLSGNIFGLPNHFKLRKKQLLYIVKTINNLQ